MKKLLAIGLLAACATGCVMNQNRGIESAITIDVATPATSFIDNSVKPEKKGVASAHGVICFVEGDASLKAAMDNGGIRKVHHVDYLNRNILGIVGTYTTVVYGE